jgi:hypothetical protein
MGDRAEGTKRPERWTDADRYVRLASTAERVGWVYEHRFVMTRVIGGALPEGALVHHRNRIRDGNSPGNLLLIPDEDLHRTLHRAMAAGHAAEVRALELSFRGWADLLKDHFGRGGRGPIPAYSGDLRPRPVTVLMRLPSPSGSTKRRFIVRLRSA